MSVALAALWPQIHNPRATLWGKPKGSGIPSGAGRGTRTSYAYHLPGIKQCEHENISLMAAIVSFSSIPSALRAKLVVEFLVHISSIFCSLFKLIYFKNLKISLTYDPDNLKYPSKPYYFLLTISNAMS